MKGFRIEKLKKSNLYLRFIIQKDLSNLIKKNYFTLIYGFTPNNKMGVVT